MTDILEQFININKTNLQFLHEEIIPKSTGTAEYLAFQNNYLRTIFIEDNKILLSSLDNLLRDLHNASAEVRRNMIAAFAHEAPALFKRVYDDLITYFYSTLETAARVRLLADSGPREPSPHFDPTLLDAVIANQSGKRRL